MISSLIWCHLRHSREQHRWEKQQTRTWSVVVPWSYNCLVQHQHSRSSRICVCDKIGSALPGLGKSYSWAPPTAWSDNQDSTDHCSSSCKRLGWTTFWQQNQEVYKYCRKCSSNNNDNNNNDDDDDDGDADDDDHDHDDGNSKWGYVNQQWIDEINNT